MPIEFSQSNKQFHIYNHEVSYIFSVLSTGVLGHLYYGKRLPLERDYTYGKTHMFHVLKVFTDEENLISYEDTMQELPVYGHGDYRDEAIRLTYEDGSSLNQFVYKDHEIVQGTYDTEFGQLPRSIPKNIDQATTLKVILFDAYREVEVQLFYTIFEQLPVMTRHTRVINKSNKTYTLDKCTSMSLDFAETNYQMMQLDGAWSRERHVNIRNLSMGRTSFGSTRGSSGANHNPYFALISENSTEDQGQVYGVSLVYSGNFEASADINAYNQLRSQIGIHSSGFKWNLSPGTSFTTPEAVMAFSPNGLNGLSQVQHQFIKQFILPKDIRTKAQVLINTWEAAYFDFDEDTLLDLAKESVKLGVNLFVLDDGWFVGRNSDHSALGDWFVDEKKLPHGLRYLSDEIHKLGMDFGLWIEPEMINMKSDLYKKHPDWVVHHPAYNVSVGRHQYVLDFSNHEVVDYIYNRMALILEEANPQYVKWDMNRLIAEPYSLYLKAENQGEFSHRYMLGVYDLYRSLTKRFPAIMFESCASGGARFDLGMLCFSVQSWTSDDNDPVERLKTQIGTSYLYPVKCMGSHVSANLTHQTLRETSILFKSHVALFGSYGLEFDVRKLSSEDKLLLGEQVKLFKEYQALIHNGTYIRLETPFKPTGSNHNNITSWMVVDEDKDQAIVGIYQTSVRPSPNVQRLYLKGLDPNKVYAEKDSHRSYSGIELMELGYIMDDFYTGSSIDLDHMISHKGSSFGHGDFTSKLLVLNAV